MEWTWFRGYAVLGSPGRGVVSNGPRAYDGVELVGRVGVQNESAKGVNCVTWMKGEEGVWIEAIARVQIARQVAVRVRSRSPKSEILIETGSIY